MKFFSTITSLGAVLTLPLLTSHWITNIHAAESSPAKVELTGKKWIDMDYGPYLTASLQVAPDNIAYKGVIIRLNEGQGGVSKGNQFVVFDTDTLRYAAAWSGEGLMDWRSIVYDGSHGTHPSLVGQTLLINPVGPGWAHPSTGSWNDPRIQGRDKKLYGPLPRQHAHWKGLYLHDNKVLLSYSVGDTHVLELPDQESVGANSLKAWSRTLNIGPRSKDLWLQVMSMEGQQLSLMDLQGSQLPNRKVAVLSSGSKPKPANSNSKFNGSVSWDISNPEGLEFHDKDFSVFAHVKVDEGGTIFAQTPSEGDWKPDHKTFFVQNGRLHFDIGWVGAVRSNKRINDGKWHHVGATFAHEKGQITLYVDGKEAGEGILKPKVAVKGYAVRIGYTSPNFPNSRSAFSGSINEIAFYQRLLDEKEITQLSSESPFPQISGLLAQWKLASSKTIGKVPDSSSGKHGASLTTVGSGTKQSRSFDSTIAFVLGGPSGTEWGQTDSGQLRLRIPAGQESTRLKLVMAGLSQDENISLENLKAGIDPPEDLKSFIEGGTPRWTDTLETKERSIGFPTGPYVVESITEPATNPYRSWMRLGGFDFFDDDNRAAVCTWMGDVWIVTGLNSKPARYEWKRIATGMFQPLGLKIVNETIYVTCRDQITRLHDLNSDGEIDFYENFNNDAQVTEHFHEFAMDLQTDDAGNFYYAKGARHAKDALVPQHGTLIRISPDGKESEIVASGFRAPNGVCVNPDGTFFVSDQEGHWTPKNRINHVRKGGFYGNMMAYHDGLRPYEANKPVTWIHNSFDRSPSEQLWVTSEQWGPLQGSLLNLSYGVGQISLVMRESSDGITQGGIVRMPIPDFPTGIMRGRFHPGDGQLYVCGLFGWAGNKTKAGGLYRVRYTGKPVHVPVALEAKKSGLRITFSGALDSETASDPESYAVRRWGYRRTGNYGSRDYKVSNPDQQGRDSMEVKSAVLSADGKSVFLEIADLKPVMQMEIKYRIRSADGQRVNHEIQHTIHYLGD